MEWAMNPFGQTGKALTVRRALQADRLKEICSLSCYLFPWSPAVPALPFLCIQMSAFTPYPNARLLIGLARTHRGDTFVPNRVCQPARTACHPLSTTPLHLPSDVREDAEAWPHATTSPHQAGTSLRHSESARGSSAASSWRGEIVRPPRQIKRMLCACSNDHSASNRPDPIATLIQGQSENACH